MPPVLPGVPVVVPLRVPVVPVVELGVVAEPPVVLLPDVRLVDWHPAASTAARVKPSRVTDGRMIKLKAMKIPRKQDAKCATRIRAIHIPSGCRCAGRRLLRLQYVSATGGNAVSIALQFLFDKGCPMLKAAPVYSRLPVPDLDAGQ
jgi:hypothetical protein